MNEQTVSDFKNLWGTQKMAERGRFELPDACASAVFKTAALNHSTISPGKCCRDVI